MAAKTAAAPPATAQTKDKAAAPAEDRELTERLRLEVERAVQRSLNAVELLGAPPPKVGSTPKTVLHRRGTMELVHYHAVTDEVYRVPLLFVMAVTNKAYILERIPHVFRLMCASVDQVLEHAEVVVIANDDAEFEQARSGLRPGRRLVDLTTRRHETPTTDG